MCWPINLFLSKFIPTDAILSEADWLVSIECVTLVIHSNEMNRKKYDIQKSLQSFVKQKVTCSTAVLLFYAHREDSNSHCVTKFYDFCMTSVSLLFMVLHVVFSCAQGRSEYDRTLKAMTTVTFMADGALCNFRALIILI